MKTRTTISILLAVVLSAISLAGDKEQITGLYRTLEKAIKAKDLKTIRWTATPDLKWKNTDGRVQTLDELMMQLKQQFAMTQKITTCMFKVEDWKIMGNKAVVWSSFKIAGDVKGEDMKVHKVVNWGKSKDYFRKTKDGWKCYMVEEIKEEATWDGKPMPMMGKAKGK